MNLLKLTKEQNSQKTPLQPGQIRKTIVKQDKKGLHVIKKMDDKSLIIRTRPDVWPNSNSEIREGRLCQK